MEKVYAWFGWVSFWLSTLIGSVWILHQVAKPVIPFFKRMVASQSRIIIVKTEKGKATSYSMIEGYPAPGEEEEGTWHRPRE